VTATKDGVGLAAERKLVAARGPSALARIRGFFVDAYKELGKVIWPSREDVRKFTLVVIVAVVAVALFMHLWDRILGYFTRPLFAPR